VESTGRYVMLISVHGLIRGSDLELGRDADTGGQTKYVVELARVLGTHPEVDQVDLVTQRIDDPRVDESYAAPVETLGDRARIVRVRCGPGRYQAKEKLWPYLDGFADNILHHIRSKGRAPDLIHGHYADAGYVAAQLSGVLGTPMVFTGHSLGRVKRQRLLDKGNKPESIERRYKITRRIEAEETALEFASFVVASTRQEIREQYELYDRYEPERMLVIPPGVDLDRFTPPPEPWSDRPRIEKELNRFLTDPEKPMILALSRPDPRKNIATLIQAYAENRRLRELANLVLVAGTRTNVRRMDRGPRDVLTDLLFLIDRYDLYGSVAYPKHHEADDVPDLYRLAAQRRGVFVNPALTEPFGLTLLEAAACGLPIVATADGGPQEIVEHCENGTLIDPLDAEAMGEALLHATSDRKQWRRWSENGIRGVREHYSWPVHVDKYIRAAQTVIDGTQDRRTLHVTQSPFAAADRLLVTDIDNTLTGDREGLRELLARIRDAGDQVAFGIATGRSLELTRGVLEQWEIPMPDLTITSAGSALYYGPHAVQDKGWSGHIRFRWRPELLRETLAEVPGIKLQLQEGQDEYKISYDVDPAKFPGVRDILSRLRQRRLRANVVFSHGAYLDILPIRASKGTALRYFANKWGVALDRCLVAGDSGTDEEMLTGNTLAVVVGNHDEELEKLRGAPRIYFAEQHHARGILEGIQHYRFLGDIRIPEPEAITDERNADELSAESPGRGVPAASTLP
jgi:sucrose-phosphate synthase